MQKETLPALYQELKAEIGGLRTVYTSHDNTPANQRSCRVWFEMAQCLLLGVGGVSKPDVKKAIQFFDSAISRYDKDLASRQSVQPALRAAFVLGDIYLYGRFGVPQERETGIAYYSHAAEKGYGPACEFLGNSYCFEQNGFKKDLKQAAKYYKLGYGDGGLDTWIPICYYYGFMVLHQQGGLAQSHKTVIAAYNKALTSNNLSESVKKEIYRTIADIYDQGKPDLPQNKKAAWENYSVLAHANDAYAQFKTAEGFFNGTTTFEPLNVDVKEREKSALEWFLKAEKQGEPNATNFLGWIYENGKCGLAQNKIEALRLYELAATRKHPSGAFNAGLLHEFGRHGAVNLQKAVQYYQMALNLGYGNAKQALDRVQSTIADEEAKRIRAEKARRESEEQARRQAAELAQRNAAAEEEKRRMAAEIRRLAAVGVQRMQMAKQDSPAVGMNTEAIAKQLEIPINQLQIHKEDKLGEGGFGLVCKGTYNNVTVAVKTLKAGFLEGDKLAEFNHEMKVMYSLRHDSIITLIGISKDLSQNQYLILEYAPCGSLRKMLTDKSINLTLGTDLKIMRGLSAGLDYLHGRDFLHRDIKSLNVLMFDNYVPKLADFGLSKFIASSTECYTANPKGTLCWMAPENLQGDDVKFTPRSDVYSLVMVFYEILSGSVPFSNYDHPGKIIAAILGGRPPSLPEKTPSNEIVPESLKALIRRGWSLSVDDRPSAAEVSRELQSISRNVGLT